MAAAEEWKQNTSTQNATWLMHTWDMTHLCMRHESFVMCDVTRSYMIHDSFMRATWRIYICNMARIYMTHPCMRHDSFIHDASIYATWLVYTWYMSNSDLSVHVVAAQVEWKQSISTSRRQSCDPSIGFCDVTHSYVRHDSLIRETWLIYKHDMTHLCVWHDWNIRVTWLIHSCAMNHSYVRHHTIVRASPF